MQWLLRGSAHVYDLTMDKIAVGAVVTAFYPDRMLDQLIEGLSRQVVQVVVIDNTPLVARVVDRRSSAHNLEYIRVGRNLGLAAALNRGVEYLRQFSLSHISFWDQDSMPPSGYIHEALDRSRFFMGWPNIIVCGRHVRPFYPITKNMSHSEEEVIRLITSGMVVPVSVLQSVGRFRESFFVDAVDTDFSLRARAQGVVLYLMRDLIIQHRFGDPSRSRKLLFFRTRTSGHPVWRQYWIARNEAILMDEYRHLDAEAVRVIKKAQRRWFLRALLAGPDRVRLMIAIVTGRQDGRTGQIRESYDPRKA